MRGWGRGIARGALLAAVMFCAGPVWAAELQLEREYLQVQFDAPMHVLGNRAPVITSTPARRWECSWADDTTLSCDADEPLPPATPVRVEVPALRRADGSIERAHVFRDATDRPSLGRGYPLRWVDGVPSITVHSDFRISEEQARTHLWLEAGSRRWPIAAVVRREETGREDTGREDGARFSITLPPGLPTDEPVALVATAGLLSEDGPLPSRADQTLVRFLTNEPFRVRGATCARAPATAPLKLVGKVASVTCIQDTTLSLQLSGTLDDASVEQLRRSLPAGVSVARGGLSEWWGERGVEYSPGDAVTLTWTLPVGADFPLVLGSGLRDMRGRSIEPITLKVTVGPHSPTVRAKAGSALIGDVARAGELELVNAPAIRLRALGIGAAPVVVQRDVASSRGTRATVGSPETQAVLSDGGFVTWGVGAGASIELAAPAFDLALLAPNDRSVVVWAMDWDTVRPLPGARVELGLLGADGRWTAAADGVTDRDGIARLEVPAGMPLPDVRRGTPASWWVVRATDGERRAVRPFTRHQGARSPFDVHHPWPTRQLFIATDRPLYRAGDTVRIHGWSRAIQGGRLSIQVPESFPLVLEDDRGAGNVLQWVVTPGADGAFSIEARLPEHMLDGEYCFVVPGPDGMPSEASNGCVFVGTFRPSELWAEARTSRSLVRNGESLEVDIEAGYLSGGPASSVKVLATAAAVRRASPADVFTEYAPYAFGNAREEGWSEVTRPVSEGVLLDANGRATLKWPVTLTPGDNQDRRAASFERVEGSATLGIAGGESVVTQFPPVWVASADAFVGLRLAPYTPDSASPITATAVVIDSDGRIQPGGDVTLTVTRSDTDTTGELVATCTLRPGVPTYCAVPRTVSGNYVFRAQRDGAADAVVERFLYRNASTPARPGTPGRNAGTRLKVDVAPSSHDAPVQLTLEHGFEEADALVVITSGDAVLHTRRIDAGGMRKQITVPTFADGRSSVVVRVLVRERTVNAVLADGTRVAPRYSEARVTVNVPLRPRAQGVQVRFEPSPASPGSVARLVVRNRSATPRRITVAVFDDALRSLAGDRWNAFDPRGAQWLGKPVDADYDYIRAAHFGSFGRYAERELPWPMSSQRESQGQSQGDLELVGDVLFNITANDGAGLQNEDLDMISVTGSRIPRASEASSPVMTMARADVENAGDGFLRQADALGLATTPGARVRPSTDHGQPAIGRGPATDRSAFGARVRNAFLQTVLWEPSVTLQPGEERVFTLTLPDNLTRWHAAAWSVSGDDDFTLDTADIEVGLPVEVRLLTPARLYPGDRARLIGNVRHTGDAAATVETALWTEGAEADATAQVPLVAGGQAPFALQVAPTDADQARTSALRAVAAARVNGVADAVSRGITLASPRIRATRVQAGWLGRRPVQLDLPTLPRTATDALLSVTLLPGADALVHDWIDDLHRYPHRCWEQILSRAVAAAVALERGDGDRFPDAKAAIDEALRNIAVFQDERGAFRYFADEDGNSRGDPVLTAYSVRALRLLSTLGYDVPLKPISKADGYLNLAHRNLDDSEGDRIRLAYVAAGQERPRRDLTDRVWSAFDTLPLHAQVAAVSAMADGQHPQASVAMQRLMKRAPLRGEARVLQAGERSDRWMGSDLREQCALLDVLYRHPALVSEADRRALVMGLGSLYSGGIDDVDTQTGAVCLMALRALPKAEGSGVTLEVAHGDARTTLALADGAPRTFTTPALAGGAVRMRGTVPGEAPASYRVEVQYTEDAREATSTAIGFALERRHAVLRDGQWVPVQGQQVREGDWVRVTLVVRTAAERHFVAITDDVPGGLQPTDLTLSGVAGLDLQAVSSTGSGWFGTRRLDPVAPKFYARYLPEGTHEVHYFARVGNAGDYLAAPAHAELMYGAATRARTGAQRLEFLPQE